MARMEIISGVERRRRWSKEGKRDEQPTFPFVIEAAR